VNKEVIKTEHAPGAIGPYSQAIKVGNLLFMSGQIPLDPKSGQIVGANVSEHTEQVMKNLKGVLEAAGLTFNHIVKTTVFLKDMGEFVAFNETYAKFLQAPYPARATVEVARLPKDVRVEIEAVAYIS
jgi:2-iminobutanoate/2-iminopropanoate deaminase